MKIFYTLVALVLATSQAAGQDTRSAYSMTIDNHWTIRDGLGEKAFLVSLQGLVNREAPNLYFVYPPDWTYPFPASFKDYLTDVYNFQFEEIDGLDAALRLFRDHVKGYVVWDQDVRTSLIVSFTTAGLENAVVVSEDLIPLVESAGIPMVEDFRGKFTDWSDYQIYDWAYKAYWDRVDQGYLIYIGGLPRERMEAGIADMAVMKRAFATDLSVDPADTLEYQLSNQIFDQMEPWSFVLGWHSYGKDLEAQHIAQMSRHTLRQEGLNTFPNMSFLTHIKVRDGYTFRNQHNVEPDEVIVPEAKVYITCVQTDGLGIGAWFKEGRGEIPYAWEVADGISMELFPVLLEFFYETATPNDYFIGALSGPNYMYPKSIPKERLAEVVSRAREQMDMMDLRVFGMMDYTEGNRYFGNIDLPKYVVDAYYEGMPDILGFINGYGPAHTNDFRDGLPLISYDYYLGGEKPEDDATQDLQELINLNSQRPYFLALHVRNWSDVHRVTRILDGLGDDVEVVPMDVFMKLASEQPTFRTHYLD